jgi:uncharacterized protein (TIGR03435 family)
MPKKYLARISFAVLLSFQAQAAKLAFEVASVKASAPFTGGRVKLGMSLDPGRVTISGLPLKAVLAQAYEVKEQQLVAPDWMESSRFDIVAKLPEGTTKDQIPEMLQALLADRFKMTVHKESRLMPIYALVVGKAGAKLKNSDTDGNFNMMMTPKGRQMTGKASLDRFAELLSKTLDRPVVNLTELKGTYDIDLTWTPDETDTLNAKMIARTGGAMGGPGEPRSSDGSDAPTLFVALQETMGLKLEARKAPGEMIVVDHAEKIPIEN